MDGCLQNAAQPSHIIVPTKAARVRGDPAAVPFAGNGFHQRRRQGSRVLRRHQQPGVVGNHLGNAAHAGGDHRNATGHRFQDHVRHAFVMAGQTQQVGRAKPVAQRCVRHGTGQRYAIRTSQRRRAFQQRIQPKVTLWPNMGQAGDYAATLHYLKAVADLGPAAAKKDGAAVVARMKAMPTDDDCFGVGRIREDGRKIHPCYLLEAKKHFGIDRLLYDGTRGEFDAITDAGRMPKEFEGVIFTKKRMIAMTPEKAA